MIQDVDGVSQYIDLLVHQYTIFASCLHAESVTIRPFAYRFDGFHRCINPRHVTASDDLSILITTVFGPFIPTLYHTLIKFSTICSFRSVHPIQHQNTEWYTLPVPVAHPPPINWISFDSVINSFDSLLFRQGYNALQHIIYESD